MGWEEDRKLFADKLESLIKGIDEIKAIQGNRLITPEMSVQMDRTRKEAKRLLPKLKDGIFEIAVIGLEKAGKSSFVNAYLDRVILPTKGPRCTYTSTSIRHSTDRDRAKVEFYSTQEFDRLFSQKLASLQIPDSEKYNMRTMSLAQYQQLYEKFASPEIKKIYGNSLNTEIEDTIANKAELSHYLGHEDLDFEGDELENENFQSFITSPGKAMAVKDVTIFSTKMGDMKDAILYDVPGFNSPTIMHREQTKTKMAEADVVVIISKGNEPSITAEGLDFYSAASDEYGCTVKDKIFLFANKMDFVASLAEYEEAQAEIYSGWIQKFKIIPAENRGRIIFGSANAKLGDKVIGGEESRRKLASWGQDDGMAKIKAGLTHYYKKERLPALLSKVNQLRHEVEVIFAGLEKLNLDEDQSGNMDRDLAMRVLAKQRKNLKAILEDLRKELTNSSKLEKPLKQDISSKIHECVSEERYGVNKDELDKIDKSFATISTSEQPSKIDAHLRDVRFEKMHKEFIDAILGSVVERHNMIREEILKRFLQSLDVDPSNPGLTKLRENTEDFCNLNKYEDEAYYHSLIERFARDLFEVQIQMRHGKDRLNKFKEEASNFFSLGVFYDQEDAAHEDQTAIRFTNPADSRLWRIILYPESLGEAQTDTNTTSSSSALAKEVLEKVKQKLKLENLGPMLEELIFAIVASRGRMAWGAIELALQNMQKGNTPSNRLREARDLLEPLLARAPESSNAAPAESNVFDERAYLDNVSKKHINYNYDFVAKEFSDDVRALRESLLKAFVPAINLDKAFLAKEVKAIEDIIEKIGSDDDFIPYINTNLETIERAKMAELKQANELRMQDMAVLAHIKKILKSMDDLPTEQAENSLSV